jgi:hypothetical protein
MIEIIPGHGDGSQSPKWKYRRKSLLLREEQRVVATRPGGDGGLFVSG